jgi:hypothetical protein
MAVVVVALVEVRQRRFLKAVQTAVLVVAVLAEETTRLTAVEQASAARGLPVAQEELARPLQVAVAVVVLAQSAQQVAPQTWVVLLLAVTVFQI